MNKIKQFYSSPTAELLVVRFEGGFLTSTFGDNGTENGNPINPEEGDGWGPGWGNN